MNRVQKGSILWSRAYNFRAFKSHIPSNLMQMNESDTIDTRVLCTYSCIIVLLTKSRKCILGGKVMESTKGHFTKVYSIKGVDLKICLGFF